MELSLYRRYERALLTEHGIRPFRDRKIQELIEQYSRDLGLDDEILDRVEAYADEYARILGRPYRLRYYQILALYFTEHFFDERAGREHDARTMLAYWMATGSGKTGVMHLNVIQYLDRLARETVDFDRLQVVLTTPGVNLIEQHRREMQPLVAALNLDHGGRIDLMVETTSALLQHDDDYWRLPDDGRTQRLVLVDEAHVGLGSTTEGEFVALRRRLNEAHSFLFEYSATYHNIGKDVAAEYGDAIVFDYNYARFFKDGYGKDYSFKVVGQDTVDAEAEVDDNLAQCFAVTQDKIRAWQDLAALSEAERVDLYGTSFPPRPLIAFMGNTVEDPKKAGKETSDDEVSDIKKVIRYLAALDQKEREAYRAVFGGDTSGALTVTRSAAAGDELLLSYGEGQYWGIVNVGNAGAFFSGLDEDALGIVKANRALVPPSALFANLEAPASPINVLIGSRKFAEGWNSFRVGVIGLINLGKSKGNKIIQIFGRGVRIHGHDGDGRRHAPEHVESYFAIPDSDKRRKLETLAVLSLKASYLTTFVESVQKEAPPETTFSIRVSPAVFKLDGGEEITFEDLRRRLPIFKLRAARPEIKRVVLDQGTIEYEYLEDGVAQAGTVETFRVPRLDYRTDKTEEPVDVAEDLRIHLARFASFIDRAGLARHVRQKAHSAKLMLLARQPNGTLAPPQPEDLVQIVDALHYRGALLQDAGFSDLALLDKLLRRVVEDVIAKVKNRVNHVINQARYTFDEPLTQSTEKQKGDFIYEYAVTRTFESADEKAEFEAELEEQRDQLRLLVQSRDRDGESLAGPDGPHLYEPLLDAKEVKDRPELSVRPDLLNAGEKKFIQDLAEYADQHFPAGGDRELYVLRNVETLKSIGVYLETDEGAYFPDFVVWVVEPGRVTILLVDPKGQMGMTNAVDPTRLNEKVRLALREEGGTLRMLGDKLTEESDASVEVHSFLLLRDSSKMGTSPNQSRAWAEANMLPHNILRLDWHPKREDGTTSPLRGLWDSETYLDLMFGGVEDSSLER